MLDQREFAKYEGHIVNLHCLSFILLNMLQKWLDLALTISLYLKNF